jgi:hypothetical protein
VASFGADAYSFVWDSWVQWYLLEFTFGLYDLLAFYQRLGLYYSDCSRRKCTLLWHGAKPFSIFLASCWLAKMDITPKVVGTLRQRYAECKVALKLFRRPLPKMVLYRYGMSTTSKVMYSVRGVLEVPNDTGSVIVPTGLVLFPLKP